MTTIVKPAPDVERDRWGRPLVIPPDGGKAVPYRRATTFIDVLSDRFALELWKQRQVVDGLARRPDLVLKAASAAGDKQTLNDVAKAASEAAGASAAATTGTALHKITEQLDLGEDPLIPPSAQADVDAYRRATQHLEVRDVEVFVVNDRYKVGGTFDRVVVHEGVPYVADIKTGKIDYGQAKIAMQLGVYANSERYDPSTGSRSALDVDDERGLVIHLPAGAGECTLRWAYIDVGYNVGAKLCADVWDWRKREGLLRAPEPVADLTGLIGLCGDVKTLTSLWRNNQAIWTAAHTQAATQRKQQLAKEERRTTA